MTHKIKKMINNGTEYKIGSIDSSNDTYENIIHLTQEEYDAIENPDSNTMYSTPDNVESGAFCPENEGTVGQVLTKTQTGYAYCNIPGEIPAGGIEGQVLTKTYDGVAWCDSQGGNSGPMIDLLVVGGGGGGGFGGGGGGAVIDCRGLQLGDNKSFCITIGGGGCRGTSCNRDGCNGGDSCFDNIIAYGGGGGGGAYASGPKSGGNGGGSGSNEQIPGFGKQGFSGGPTTCCGGGGGGGGAGGPGYSGTLDCPYGAGGNGGQGYYNGFWSECLYGSGGGGGGFANGPVGKAFPGGGNGGPYGYSATYYGGGGGGAGCITYNCSGGFGCRGVIIVKYLTNGDCGISSATGGTVTTEGDYTVHTFTSNDTFCITG